MASNKSLPETSRQVAGVSKSGIIKPMINKLCQKLASAGLLMLIILFLPLTALAVTDEKKPPVKSTKNISQSVAQSYSAGPEIQLGMIVTLDQKKTGFVVPMTKETQTTMLGVVVKPNDTTLTLSPQTATTQQVFVAPTGRYLTLVSNQNGPIKPGDYIAISAITGVGMKADTEQETVLGKAVTAFNGSGNVVGKVSVKDQTGKTSEVSITRMNVELEINRNPLANTATDKLPSFLSNAAIAVAGKPVSTARIYLGVVTLIAASVVASMVVYSGVRSGMIAIGRNPLSRKSIIKSLIQTVIAGIIIFITGVFAVYLLLKL